MMRAAGKKAWDKNPKIGSEAMLSADFGESFIAYLLSKEGVDVVRASSTGFDILAIDSEGKLLPRRRLICISVKARISKSSANYKPTIPVGSKKLAVAAQLWNAGAWVAIVVGSARHKKLAAFLFPLEDIPKLRRTALREDVVAVSALDENETGNVLRLF